MLCILNMSSGIFKHGLIKTILTRGFLSPIFKSMLYTKEDNIHNDFVEVVNDFVVKVPRDIKPKSEKTMLFWLAIVPKNFFEAIFIDNDKAPAYLNVVENATQNSGKECAYITQAFILYNLEQILQNKAGFKEAMGFTIEDLENVTKIILGEDNKILTYLNHFREKFDLKKIGQETFIDPRDWSIFYVAEITKQLINNKEIAKKSLGKWDEDLIEKTKFVLFTGQFFSHQNEIAMKIVPSIIN